MAAGLGREEVLTSAYRFFDPDDHLMYERKLFWAIERQPSNGTRGVTR
jgi:hypothetical protein